MEPYKAFACLCGAGDVVLRESLGKIILDVNFLWKEERVPLLTGSPGASTTPSYSPGPSTPQSYSPRPSRTADCANCQLLIGKLQVLEPTLEMYMHPEKHTIDSTTLPHELYNDMEKFSLE
ncbi:hypothetical protein Tco_1326844 [Tanacetum coccineum]